MLVFLLVILILAATVLIQIVGRSRISLGTKWLILAVAVVITWGASLVLRTHLPAPAILTDWFPSSGSSDSIIFSLDASSWMISYALLSVLVGIVFTETTRLGQKANLSQWTEILLVTALGLLTILANSSLTFVLTWTLIDVVEIIVLAQIKQQGELNIQTLAVFGSRFIGTVLVLLAMILGNQAGSALDISMASGTPFVLLILGAGFRLGVIPLHLPYTEDVPLRRSLGTLLRMVAPLSAFVFISRFPVVSEISGWLVLVYAFSILGALFGAIKWFSVNDELIGRPYWLLVFSSFVMIAFLNGHSETALPLGLIMVVIGSWCFLQTVQYKWIKYLLPFIILSLIGIPFTPSASLINGLTSGPKLNTNFVVWVSMAFLAAGVIKHSKNSESNEIHIERWMRLFYSIGLIFLILVPWVTGIWQFSEWQSLFKLGTGIITLIFLGVILALTYQQKLRQLIYRTHFDEIKEPLQNTGNMLDRFFHFDWFYRFFGFVMKFLQGVFTGMNTILEGEGGILWAMVFLALLISLIISGNGS